MRKLVSIALASILLIGVLAGCAGNKETGGNKDVDLKIWSFTDELKKPITKFEEKNGVKVELTIVPIADYPTKLKPVLESGVGAPDVFTGEIAFIKQWVDAGYWENLSEEPYSVEKQADKFVPYVFDLGKDKDGNVRAVSWQTTPGGIFYKRSIAKEVLGTDDPAEVGNMLSSMDKVFEVAEKMKAKGYKMFPDEGSIRWFAQGDNPQPWVNKDNELQLTDERINFMDYAKELRTNNYTALAPEWSPSWFEAMDKPIKVKEKGNEVETQVFSYVLPTWGLHSVLKTNVKETTGDWALTSGPTSYFWGGTWLGVYSKSKNKELAYKFVEMMTQDDEFLTEWAKETGDVLSYLPVTNKIKDDFSEEFLGGQNNYEFFLGQSEKIEPGIVTKYDQQIDTLYGSAVQQYAEGKKSKEEAIKEFYSKVKNAYPDINVPNK
ncbi:ABC transporter substrate-binding protein [Metabacillus iocasae]|uniref:ABC-type glycerol-3-phosphate transport system substrate-binding protein n=1 Tax=Priestia iocasae TaxID=2291674 RepID=A0ABS2QYP1_9BACI|nr:ABC transporter substrate-binding protein [Metabacillus iocasae]MBM7704537.1 ABC-type glycerol-3-phosphate transport system substrate-binding protein [Metabacillus iocasae]